MLHPDRICRADSNRILRFFDQSIDIGVKGDWTIDL